MQCQVGTGDCMVESKAYKGQGAEVDGTKTQAELQQHIRWQVGHHHIMRHKWCADNSCKTRNDGMQASCGWQQAGMTRMAACT